jgi:hypothetical protein
LSVTFDLGKKSINPIREPLPPLLQVLLYCFF